MEEETCCPGSQMDLPDLYVQVLQFQPRVALKDMVRRYHLLGRAENCVRSSTLYTGISNLVLL